MFTLQLVRTWSAAGSAQTGSGLVHISFLQLWIRSLFSRSLWFFFSQKEKIGGKLMKSGPRTLKLAVETLKMRNLLADVDSFTSQSFAEKLAVCFFLSLSLIHKHNFAFFSSCLQTSDMLKIEIKKKRAVNCDWLSSSLGVNDFELGDK